MAFRTIGLRTIVLSSAFAKKSTGKPGTTAWTWVPLGAAFSRFALQAVNATTVATSGFTLTLVGTLTTVNPRGLGSSKYTALLSNYTSAQLGAVVQTTKAAPIPVTFIGIRSTKFTTAANRSLRVTLCAVP